MPDSRKTRPAVAELEGVRALLFNLCRDRNVTHVSISKACSRDQGYLHTYLFKRTPKLLPDDHRIIIAKMLGVDEMTLREAGQMPQFTAARASAHPQDVPLFTERDLIDPAHAVEWTPRPSSSPPGAGGMFAVQVERGRDRLRPGDTLYAANRRPRVGDITVCMRARRIEAMGELDHADQTSVRINIGGEVLTLPAATLELWKVTNLVPA